jgi:N-acetylglucosamine kinase-like BadF-type ATPase
MILVADSGSTKTTWCLIENNSPMVKTCHTSGINPFYQDTHDILHILEQEFNFEIREPANIFFYGAGCANRQVNETVIKALNSYFGPASLAVESDLMAAARSLCGNHEGIACILGTGSNSCQYNGREIVQHVSPLGYVLGDEGSGASIGKSLVSDILKNQLPSSIITRFFNRFPYNRDQILDHVYKKPFPNRFLAQFTIFISENPGEESLNSLVRKSFKAFFTRNIAQYPKAHDIEIGFTGSIAWYFADILREAALGEGFRVGDISRTPMEGLIRFHQEHYL